MANTRFNRADTLQGPGVTVDQARAAVAAVAPALEVVEMRGNPKDPAETLPEGVDRLGDPRNPADFKGEGLCYQPSNPVGDTITRGQPNPHHESPVGRLALEPMKPLDGGVSPM